ncbi:MAG TPA: hypothetical protein VFU43_13030 [Streptosporangiaceae bacterium]|nr:hypothetical protein [Streptosporangiaceae bacterium]
MTAYTGGSGVLAHGVGGRQDLPIPLSFLLVGAGLAVVVSFVTLGVLWRSARFRSEEGRAIPAPLQRLADHRATRAALRLAGLLVAVATFYAAAFGPPAAANPAPWTIYILFWVGLVPLSLLFGPVWKLLNPLRTIYRAIALPTGGTPLLRLSPRIGYWPAAAGLFAFTWLELVAPDPDEAVTLIVWFAVYSMAMLVGAALYGEGWFDRGDAFEVYSGLIGRLAPLGRRRDGRLALRNPFKGLAATPEGAGLVAVVCVMLGSTAYDGFSRTVFWVNLQQSGPLPRTLTGTLGLAAFVLFVALTYRLATWQAGPGTLAHSLIPIAVGYLIAHYFSLLVFGGQQAAIIWSDPLDNGANLFGTATLTVDYSLLGVTAIAVIRAGAVVAGHIGGVFAAHDRAIAVLPRDRALTGQLPLLALMVGYTVGGLTLLFAD